MTDELTWKDDIRIAQSLFDTYPELVPADTTPAHPKRKKRNRKSSDFVMKFAHNDY